MKKLFGFTLAEVLITLGIIGVVAALTIPSLIANINSAKYKTQFKKTLSTLSQAAKMSQAQYGFNFADAPDCCNPGDKNSNPNKETTFGALFNGTLEGLTWLEDANYYDK